MRRLKIKWKILLGHSIALVLLMMLTLPVMYILVSDHLYNGAKTLLLNEGDQVVQALRSGDNTNEPDSAYDMIQTGTYIAVYSNDNTQISGWMPESFDFDSQPSFDDVYYPENGEHRWMVLDRQLIANGSESGWFRVVKSLDSITSALNYLKTLIIVIILVYSLFSALAMISGGLLNRALSPVKQITETAQQIVQGDLTKRINFDGARDELGMLAETLDEMLDHLEYSFNREKRFSSDVSHELRTPITAIILSAEEALDGDKTVDEYKEDLCVILNEGRKMNSLISQLLMMARSHDGKYTPKMESIDISALTKTIVEELSEGAGNTEASISSDIEEGIIMSVEQTLYMRLIINLVDNALKYNTPGGWVKVSLLKNSNLVSLSVEDNGIGISDENLPKIWDRFFKADQSSINSSPGLGLSIVKWVAELHGGTVHVKSELNKGSLFEIQIPSK